MANDVVRDIRDYRSIIEKVTAHKDVDVETLGKLLQLQKEWEQSQGAIHFNTQMALAQGRMAAISRDSANPATRSRYASLAALDNAIRPIYAACGFSIDFTEEPYKDDVAHVVASVSCGSITHHHHIFMPFTTQGARGGAVSTPTHAKMGAITYARRGLLKMIFNLAEEDDDGNRAWPRRPAVSGRDGSAPVNKPAATADAWGPKELEHSKAKSDAVIAAFNQCGDAVSVKAYAQGLAGTLDDLSQDDYERVQAEYRKSLERFNAPAEEKPE